jgi:hypothetical protein
MGVSAAERKALKKMWSGASEKGASQIDAPDGVYQWKISKPKFGTTAGGKPQVTATYTVVGGEEDCIGKKGTMRDNLESQQNMSFFKQKLQRLGIAIPDDFGEIEEALEEMDGKIFEGTLKTNQQFQNLYVNKLIGDGDEDDDDDDDGDDESEESAIQEGDRVTFKRKGKTVEATVVDVDPEDEEATIELDDGEVLAKPFDKLKVIAQEEDDDDDEDESKEETDEGDSDEEEDEEGDEEDEEDGDEEDDDAGEVPWPENPEDAVDNFSVREAKSTLADLGYAGGKSPKKMLVDLVKVEHGESLKSARMKEVAVAVGIKVKKADTAKALAKKIKKAIE